MKVGAYAQCHAFSSLSLPSPKVQRWKPKPDVEFQDGRCLFPETGSSNMSAMGRESLLKFGLQVDFEVPKYAKSSKTKQKVELQCRGRHLEKWIWRHNSVAGGPIWTKFDRQMQNYMPMMMQTCKSKPEVAFQLGGRLFSKTGSSNISAVDWDIRATTGHTDNLFCSCDFDLDPMTLMNELDLDTLKMYPHAKSDMPRSSKLRPEKDRRTNRQTHRRNQTALLRPFSGGK